LLKERGRREKQIPEERPQVQSQVRGCRRARVAGGGLPFADSRGVGRDCKAQVEELTGAQAGLQISASHPGKRKSLTGWEPPHRPKSDRGAVCAGESKPGYVVFAGQKIPLERPRVRTREGPGKWNCRATVSYSTTESCNERCRKRMVAGLSTRNYRRAVESVLEGYGIEKSSVSRQFVAASSNQFAGAVRTAPRRSESGGC